MPKLEKALAAEECKSKLSTILKASSTSHAFLFYGPPESNVKALAKVFAKELILKNDSHSHAENKLEKEIHPDFKVLSIGAKANFHSVASIRKCIEEVQSSPFESNLKVVLIEEAEKMQEAAANALLKTLEEPPSEVVFILIAKSLSSMLPTIVSRCMKIYAPPLKKEEIVSYLVKEKSLSLEKAEKLAFLSLGNLEKAEKMAGQEAPYLEELLLDVLKELGNPSYAHFMKKLELFDQSIQKEETFEEEEVFSMLELWVREIKALSCSKDPLFFEKEAQSLKQQEKIFFQRTEDLFSFLQEMRKAFFCNIKLKNCLEALYLKLHDQSARS